MSNIQIIEMLTGILFAPFVLKLMIPRPTAVSTMPSIADSEPEKE